MSEELKITNQKDFILAEIRGNYNFENLKAYYRQIMKKCIESGHKKLMIDIRELEGTISFIDRFNLASVIDEFLDQFVKTVVLIKDNPAYQERIFETVANNRGAFVKIVIDEKEAYEFLQIDFDSKVAN